MICYTSGTTGEPKAAMLGHGNLLAAAKGAKDADFNLNENDTHLSYLPLAHSFEKIIFVMSLFAGG
jgi:long-chain acyl-CoA synthetase